MALPSSSTTFTNTAPASSAPRRRTAPNTPSFWQRRKYAPTQIADFNRLRGTYRPAGGSALVDGPTRHVGQFLDQAIRHLAGRRQLAVALKFENCRLGVGADQAGRLQLAVAIVGERALDGGDLAAGCSVRDC